MIEFFSSQTTQTVLGALNSGFVVTLELFCITLLGAAPLGLIISFGSMNRWAPFGFIARRQLAASQQLLKQSENCGGAEAEPLERRARKLERSAKRFAWFRPVSLICRLVVWVVRGTPLVLQLIIIFYGPGLMKWFNWPSGSGRFAAACVAFIINYACYFSEIYRGGIQGVPVGQQEAGQVLGMTKGQIFFKVTLLQMIKRIVPPMSNEIITLVKDTSLARVISLQEVIWMGESFMKGGAGGISGLMWPLFFTAVYYLVFTGVVTLLLGRLEKKLEFFR